MVEKEYVRGPEVINDVMFDAVVLFDKDKHPVQIKSSDLLHGEQWNEVYNQSRSSVSKEVLLGYPKCSSQLTLVGRDE